MNFLKVLPCLLAVCLSSNAFCADNARFDLVGPRVDVRVTRGTVTLPIAEVPNLQPGDKLWVKAALPADQSNHLLLIVAFLRGTTNEPPDNWFTEIDTWDKKNAEGTEIVVPESAQQAVMFLAPETGGDFKTLRSAVKGKPGLFIRADADLNEASFEQQRIERYLTAMKALHTNDPKVIQESSAKLAATLALKPNAACFKQPVAEQVTCLTQSSAPVLLADGHGQSIAEALSTGASSDFVNAASTTPTAGGGVYSAYVGTVIDLVHLVSLLATAQYVYIPGLAFPHDTALDLKLNAPPSFHNPKSVIVIGLPAIQAAKLPPLHPHDPSEVACMLKPDMSLLVEGAPLVFSTAFAHDLVLHLNRTGTPTNLPLDPNATDGGLVVTKKLAHIPMPTNVPPGDLAKTASKEGSPTDLTLTGTVRGYWGFDPFEGPTLTLQQIDGKDWKIVSKTQLIAGQDSKFTLQGDATACVQKITLTNAKDKDVNVTFKAGKDAAKDKDSKNQLALDVSLKTVQPGGYALSILQYGKTEAEKLPLTLYSGDIQLDDIKIHSGDNATDLTGHGLQDVVSVQIGGETFKPAGAKNDDKTIHLEAAKPVSPENDSDAVITLKDGRKMIVNVTAETARPGLKLLSFKAVAAPKTGDLPITLGAKDDIPLNGKLTFVVQTQDVFPRTQTIEVATVNAAVHTTLSINDNTLVLEDEHTAVGTLDPLKAFGQSAFGKLRMRPVAADQTPGDWTSLGTLVRTPQITAITCSAATTPALAAASTCTLTGTSLFLVESFAASKDFAKPTAVPTGFADATIKVPTPADGATLYLKLRDDPSAPAAVKLPAAPASSGAQTTP
jgi:hypothetical protein